MPILSTLCFGGNLDWAAFAEDLSLPTWKFLHNFFSVVITGDLAFNDMVHNSSLYDPSSQEYIQLASKVNHQVDLIF